MTPFGTDWREKLLEAVDLLNRAVAHDPSYFQAYCLLASAHDQLYFFGDDHTSARLALAEAAVQAAFRVRPDAGEAHLARAWHLYRGYLDYDSALAELEIAGKTAPNDPGAFQLRGAIQRRQGHWEESIRNFQRAVELDPRNVVLPQQIAITNEVLRRYAQANLVLDRVLAVQPDELGTKVERALVEFDWQASTQPLHEIISSVRTRDPGAMAKIADSWLVCALAERDAASIQDALAASGEIPLSVDALQFSRSFVKGLVARMTKDDDKARSAFVAARVEQEKVIEAQPDYAPALCVLGLIDAALGRKQEALREGQRAIELLPVEKDAINGPMIVAYFGAIAAWVGDRDLACQQLAIAVRHPSRLSYGQLKLLPFWDPLRGDPRFEKIVASLAPKD
jgi:tetratricopeptide (TPR) repeat protein